MTLYDVVKQISEKTSIPEENVDVILTQMTCVLNEEFISGNGGLTKIMKLAKKKEGLPYLIDETTERSECDREDVSKVVNYMVNVLGKSLKSGGVKKVLEIIKSIKKG